MDSIEARALKWATGDDTGSSSRAIMRVMTGQEVTDNFCHPSDGQDLGRCVRLLDLIPEWRPRIREMAVVSKEWKALSAVWPALEAMHHAGDFRATYDRIQGIIRPIEDARSDIIRVGKDALIKFGRSR